MWSTEQTDEDECLWNANQRPLFLDIQLADLLANLKVGRNPEKTMCYPNVANPKQAGHGAVECMPIT
jgi:hypothetical protein